MSELVVRSTLVYAKLSLLSCWKALEYGLQRTLIILTLLLRGLVLAVQPLGQALFSGEERNWGSEDVNT